MIEPAAQIHYRAEFQPGLQWVFPYLLLALPLGASLAFALWVQSMAPVPNPFLTAALYALLLLSAGGLIFWMRRRFRRRLILEVFHTGDGAQLTAHFRTAGGRLFRQCVWPGLREVRYEFRFRDIPRKKGVTPAVDSFDADGRRQPLFTLWDPDFRDFVIPKPEIERLAAEINRQQDGSWRAQPLMLTADDDVEYEIPAQWDEAASVVRGRMA